MSKKKNKTNESSEDFSTIKSCAELQVPDELKGEAMAAAVKERADNLLTPGMMPIGLNSMAVAMSNHAETSSIFVLAAKRWQPNRVLRVKFMDNPPAVVRQKIEYYAKQWEQFVSVRFSFGNAANAEIRITCTLGIGSWSYLGTDALVIPQNKPTMNYGWFTEQTPDEEFSRTVLHEFGHALSAGHEHSHPLAGIPWNRPRVYQYYQQTQGWSQADVDSQVFFKYDLNQTNSSQYDKNSIMHYAIPADLLLNPSFAVGWNKKLSPTDKSFMKQMYP